MNGDATYETSGWYSDLFNFISVLEQWAVRGGCISNTGEAGVFSNYNYSGQVDVLDGTRCVIKP